MATPLDDPAPHAGTVRSQPAVAARAARLLRQLRLAVLASLAGLVCSAMVTRTFLRLTDFARLWPMLGNLASVLVVVACLLQWWSWRLAHQEWSGVRDVNLLVLLAPGRIAAVIAAGCAVLGPLGSIEVFRQTSPAEEAHWWALGAAVLTVLAVAFGAIHPLDPAGPRGARQLPLTERVHHHGDDDGADLDEDTLVLRRRLERAHHAGAHEAPTDGDSGAAVSDDEWLDGGRA